MKTVFLIRHGDKERKPNDPVLTELGLKQAFESGLFLQQFPIQKIIASPMARTLQTAAEIVKSLNLEIKKDKRLIERMVWSSYDIDKTELMKEWAKATMDRNYQPKFGDSSTVTGARVTALVEELPDESNTLLVTHGGAILDFLRTNFGDETLKELKRDYPEGTDFLMRHCAINKIIIDNDQKKLELLNYTKHLSVETE